MVPRSYSARDTRLAQIDVGADGSIDLRKPPGRDFE
jgi:hypothetical protein